MAARTVGRAGLLLALMVWTTGCQTVGYYAQAISGQCQVLTRQRSIREVLADEKAPEAVKARLRRVLEIRDFAARELQLPVNGHYLGYADLGRRFAVWDLYAAPEFSLEAKSWWYPVVGRLDYRGYFSEAKARRAATRLQRKGYDVYVGGVLAYSTLGWFQDPVLNTFIHESDAELAQLLFHELAHQRLFVAGDTDFNEAFAATVAEEGVRRWLAATQPAAHGDYEAKARREEEFILLVLETRRSLEALYEESGGGSRKTPVRAGSGVWSEAELRKQKQLLFDRLRESYRELKSKWGGADDYRVWMSQPLNNAQFKSVDTYYRLLPAFRRLLSQVSHDLERFYGEVRSLGKLGQEERHRRLSQWVERAQQLRVPAHADWADTAHATLDWARATAHAAAACETFGSAEVNRAFSVSADAAAVPSARSSWGRFRDLGPPPATAPAVRSAAGRK